jgi:hypothetical protein
VRRIGDKGRDSRNGQFDVLNLDEMNINLQNAPLATLTPGIGTTLFQMHPPAHGWVHSSIPDQDRPGLQAAAVLMLALGARGDYLPFAQYLTSHVEYLSPICSQLHINDAAVFGYILHDAGLFDGSYRLKEKVVSVLRTGRDIPAQSLSHAMNALAVTCVRMGSKDRLFEAEELEKEVLGIQKKILEENNLDSRCIK